MAALIASNCSGAAVDASDLGDMKSVDRIPSDANKSMVDPSLRSALPESDTVSVIAFAITVESVMFDMMFPFDVRLN
jgi:hypothetical protein